jgi:hypothetical protein
LNFDYHLGAVKQVSDEEHARTVAEMEARRKPDYPAYITIKATGEQYKVPAWRRGVGKMTVSKRPSQILPSPDVWL